MIAMILAAGRGERLRPLTDGIPKALVEVRGRSLLERHLDTLRGSGVETAVINLGWLGDSIVSRIGSGRRYGLNVIYSPEGDDILETGGGIHRALPLLSDPFLVINGDIWTDIDYASLRIADEDLAHLVMVENPDHNHTGDFALSDGRLSAAGEDRMTFSGVGIYRKALFEACQPGKFPLAPLLREAMAHGQVGGVVHTGTWIDVGTPERLMDLERLLAG